LMRRRDGTWFRFNAGNKIGIWKSRSLSGPWNYAGNALQTNSSIHIKGSDFLWVSILVWLG
jgi:arabinan endo-1,5-alpha-L-arabinosidase